MKQKLKTYYVVLKLSLFYIWYEKKIRQNHNNVLSIPNQKLNILTDNIININQTKRIF